MEGKLSKRRAAWSILDQAASSLTNFGLSLVILRSTSLREFGVFTVVYLAYQMALGLNRSLVTEPLIIRFSAAEDVETRQAAAQASGAAVLLGVAAGVLLLAIAALTDDSTQRGFLVMGAALPLLVLQDALRSAFFALGSPHHAFWNDLAWGVAMTALIATAYLSHNDSFAVLLGCWAIAGAIAAGIGIWQLRQIPQRGGALSWIGNHADLGRRFALEYVFARGSGYLALLSVSAIAGLSSLGAINAARVLFGPINVLFAGMVAVAVPEGVRLVKDNPEQLSPAVLRLGLFLGGGAVGLGTILYLLPASLGESLVGDSGWSQIHLLIVPTTVLVAAEGFVFAQRTGLRILADARQSLRAQLVAGPLILAGAIGGAFVAGATGAAWGFAIAMSFAAGLWARMFATSRNHDRPMIE